MYLRATPFGQAPDETSMLNYIKDIALNLSLPVHAPERQQPPLFFLLAAAVYKLLPSYISIRWMNLVLGSLIIPLTVACAREIWPENPGRWMLAGLLVGSLPQFQFISMSVANDTISNVLAAACVLVALKVIKGARPNLELTLWASIIAGLALLAKETDYIVALAMYAVIIYIWKDYLNDHKYFWLLLVVPLLIAGWWFVRNLYVYRSLLPHLSPKFKSSVGRLDKLSLVTLYLTWLFESFFGKFGNMTTLLQIDGHAYIFVYGTFLLYCIIGAFGFGYMLPRMNKVDARSFIAGIFVVLIPVLAFIQTLAYGIFIDFQAQGRYLYVALVPLALITTYCLSHVKEIFPARLTPFLIALLIIGVIFVDAWGVNTVMYHLIIKA